MEEVLDVYEPPYNAYRLVVCIDEKMYLLLGGARVQHPMRPDSDEKIDSEYICNASICNMYSKLKC